MDPRIVVVTGSSSGLGAGIAKAFAAHGDLVLVHGLRNLKGLAQTASEVASFAKPVRAIVADIACPTSRRQLVESAFRWRDGVDIWINAAGADVLTGSAKNLSFQEKLEKLLSVDVMGTIQVSRCVAQKMLQQPARSQKPVIINVSWDQAESGMEGDSGQFFCPTKAAVAAFSKSLAKSVGPHVRVNCIAPGWIQTAWGQSAPAIWDQRARNESMLQRWGTVDDVANTTLMLADPRLEFVNGQTLAINGGWKPSFPG